MKMVLVIYDAGIDEDLRAVLDDARIDAYTKLIGATGTGRKGHRFGTPIWPGTNNLLWSALPDAQVSRPCHAAGSAEEIVPEAPGTASFRLPGGRQLGRPRRCAG